jgi:hypothetical protein
VLTVTGNAADTGTAITTSAMINNNPSTRLYRFRPNLLPLPFSNLNPG